MLSSASATAPSVSLVGVSDVLDGGEEFSGSCSSFPLTIELGVADDSTASRLSLASHATSLLLTFPITSEIVFNFFAPGDLTGLYRDSRWIPDTNLGNLLSRATTDLTLGIILVSRAEPRPGGTMFDLRISSSTIRVNLSSSISLPLIVDVVQSTGEHNATSSSITSCSITCPRLLSAGICTLIFSNLIFDFLRGSRASGG